MKEKKQKKKITIINILAEYRIFLQAFALVLSMIGLLSSSTLSVAILISLTLLGGAFYCGFICPFGFMQDIASKLSKRLGIKKRKLPSRIHETLIFLRYILFGIYTLQGISYLYVIIRYDPRSNAMLLLVGHGINIISIFILAFFLCVSIFYERFFCNYLCMEGAKQGILSILRPMTIKRNVESCVNCKKCDNKCPMNIRVSEVTEVRSMQCINCFQCMKECPVPNTLTYHITDKLIAKGDKCKLYNKKHRYIKVAIAVSFVLLVCGISNYEIISEGIQKAFISKDKIVFKEEDDKDKTVEVYKNGTYEGIGKGFRNETIVEVEIKENKIESITIIKSGDDKRWLSNAFIEIEETILKTQSTDVDVVSGATYSSKGIIEAIKDALNKAK